jgi:hypothetical protein
VALAGETRFQPRLRASCVRLLVAAYVDTTPQEAALGNRLTVQVTRDEEMELAEALSDKHDFAKLKQIINTCMAEKKWNQYTLSVLLMLQRLVSFKFYRSHTHIAATIAPLLQLLQNRGEDGAGGSGALGISEEEMMVLRSMGSGEQPTRLKALSVPNVLNDARQWTMKIRALFPEDKDLDLDELDERGGGLAAQAGAGVASHAVRRFSMTNGASTAVASAAAAATAYAEAEELKAKAKVDKEALEQLAVSAASRLGVVGGSKTASASASATARRNSNGIGQGHGRASRRGSASAVKGNQVAVADDSPSAAPTALERVMNVQAIDAANMTAAERRRAAGEAADDKEDEARAGEKFEVEKRPDGAERAAEAERQRLEKKKGLEKQTFRRLRILAVIDSLPFICGIMLLVLLSVVLTGTMDPAGGGVKAFGYFAFLVFATELVLRMYTTASASKYFGSPFNLVDFSVVTMDIVIYGAGAVFGALDPKALRAVRLLRVFSVLRAARLYHRLTVAQTELPPFEWELPARHRHSSDMHLKCMEISLQVLTTLLEIGAGHRLATLVKLIHKSVEFRATQDSNALSMPRKSPRGHKGDRLSEQPELQELPRPSQLVEEAIEASEDSDLSKANRALRSAANGASDNDTVDEVLLDLLMYEHRPVAQQALVLLMTHHSVRETLVSNACDSQLLLTQKQTQLNASLEASLNKVVQLSETAELWGQLETEADMALLADLEYCLLALSDACRFPSRHLLPGGRLYIGNIEVQTMLYNAGALDALQSVLALREGLHVAEKRSYEKAALRRVLQLAFAMLAWLVNGSRSIQEAAFELLHLSDMTEVERLIGQGLGAETAIAETVRDNLTLIRRLPHGFIELVVQQMKEATEAAAPRNKSPKRTNAPALGAHGASAFAGEADDQGSHTLAPTRFVMFGASVCGGVGSLGALRSGTTELLPFRVSCFVYVYVLCVPCRHSDQSSSFSAALRCCHLACSLVRLLAIITTFRTHDDPMGVTEPDGVRENQLGVVTSLLRPTDQNAAAANEAFASSAVQDSGPGGGGGGGGAQKSTESLLFLCATPNSTDVFKRAALMQTHTKRIKELLEQQANARDPAYEADESQDEVQQELSTGVYWNDYFEAAMQDADLVTISSDSAHRASLSSAGGGFTEPLLQYHIKVLELLAACGVGDDDGITIAEVAIQNTLQQEEVLRTLLDPESTLEVKIALGRFFYDVFVDVQVKIKDFGKDVQVWDFMLKSQQLMEQALEALPRLEQHVRENSQFDPMTQEQRPESFTGYTAAQRNDRMTVCYMLEAVLPCVKFFMETPEYFKPELPEYAPVSTDQLVEWVTGLFEATSKLYSRDSPVLMAEQKEFVFDALEVIRTHAPVGPKLLIRPFENIGYDSASPQFMGPDQSPASCGLEMGGAAKTTPAKIHAQVWQYILGMRDPDENQDLAETEAAELGELVEVIQKLPGQTEWVEDYDLRYEPVLQKMIKHVRQTARRLDPFERPDTLSMTPECTKVGAWVLRLMRSLIEVRVETNRERGYSGWGFSFGDRDEQDNQESKDADEAVYETQRALNNAGATALCLDLINSGIHETVQEEALKLLVALLYREGGNLVVQKTINGHLSSELSSTHPFFERAHQMLDDCLQFAADGTEEEDGSGLIELDGGGSTAYAAAAAAVGGPERLMNRGLLFVRMLQLMCEGHYLPNQELLRCQPNNKNKSVCLLDACVRHVTEVSRYPSSRGQQTTIEFTGLLLEGLQGPCPGNQEHLAMNSELVETMNKILRTDVVMKGTDCKDEEQIEVKVNILKIFKAMLEGIKSPSLAKTDNAPEHEDEEAASAAAAAAAEEDDDDFPTRNFGVEVGDADSPNSVILQRIISVLQPEILFKEVFKNYLPEHLHGLEMKRASGELGADAAGDDAEEEQGQLTQIQVETLVLLSMLAEADESVREVIQLPDNVMDAVCSLEVVWGGQLQRRLFCPPAMCELLSKATRSEFVETVDRTSSEDKLAGLVEATKGVYFELRHLEMLQLKGLSVFFRCFHRRTLSAWSLPVWRAWLLDDTAR